MFGFKLCPRCQGDMFLDNDPDGWFLMCLQCGHRTYLGQMEDYHAAREFACSLYRMKSSYDSDRNGEVTAGDAITV